MRLRWIAGAGLVAICVIAWAAIDSAAKRASTLNHSHGVVLPIPDGTIAEGDRAHLAMMYSGFDYDPPVPGGAWPLNRATEIDLEHLTGVEL